jgi:cbb3-type cytochrome oxidase subunit 3
MAQDSSIIDLITSSQYAPAQQRFPDKPQIVSARSCLVIEYRWIVVVVVLFVVIGILWYVYITRKKSKQDAEAPPEEAEPKAEPRPELRHREPFSVPPPPPVNKTVTAKHIEDMKKLVAEANKPATDTLKDATKAINEAKIALDQGTPSSSSSSKSE